MLNPLVTANADFGLKSPPRSPIIFLTNAALWDVAHNGMFLIGFGRNRIKDWRSV